MDLSTESNFTQIDVNVGWICPEKVNLHKYMPYWMDLSRESNFTQIYALLEGEDYPKKVTLYKYLPRWMDLSRESNLTQIYATLDGSVKRKQPDTNICESSILSSELEWYITRYATFPLKEE